MDDEEFENISLIILRVISKRHRGMSNFVKNHLITSDWRYLIDYPQDRIETVFDLIDSGRVRRKEDMKFCASLLKFIGLIGSVTVRTEEANYYFYLGNEECLLEIDNYIVKLWRERYNKSKTMDQNLKVFLQS